MNRTTNIILLKLIREASGQSQADFARLLGLTPSLLSKFEHGVLEPSSIVLKEIAEKAQYPLEFFTQPAFEISSGLIYHRKRTALKSLVRTQIEAQARLRAFDAIKIGRANGLYANLISREGRSPADAAREVRLRWNNEHGPIEDMVRYLEEHGVFVLAFDFKTDLLDGFFIPVYEDDGLESVCIALNTNAAFSPDRQRFTLAHEFGHAILHRKEFPDPAETDFEAEANDFAAELLFPIAEAKKELNVPLTFTNLKALKIRWRLSMSAIAHRALEVGTVTPSNYKRTLFFLQSSGYRKQEPTFDIPFEKPTLFKALVDKMVLEGKDPDNLLHLSSARFRRRYPDIQIKGDAA